ncbi:hypothetical protein DFH11DRAFT_104318 [Phellopilus nigrolimitatus]|nr:hypothetical protein DFH11DRAFT_104318 [Phellopilus nigrolimitatus]
MNARSVLFALCALAAAASAIPSPNPIDSGTAHVIALNNNLGCSTGSCDRNATAVNATVANAGSNNSTNSGSYSSDASAMSYNAWSPLTFIAAGGLAFSTGML